MNHGNKKGDWIKTATAEEIQNHIEKLEQNISSCQSKIEWYKQEQERRKQEVPLGVPVSRRSKGLFCVSGVNTVLAVKENYSVMAELFDVLNLFPSKESAEKHAEMLLAWRKALVANAKGEPIDIKVLLPLLKKGWVAMDKGGDWFWYKNKPVKGTEIWNPKGYLAKYFSHFNLKPAENWKTSLMECGL